MGKIKICAAQFMVEGEFSKNIKKSEYFMERAEKNNCSIICFPEIFLTGPLNKKDYEDSIPRAAKKTFSDYCKNHSIFCVMGSIIEKIRGNYYNISYLFDNKGDIIGSCKKSHLVLKSEGRYIKAGNESPVFRTRIGNIGIQICRDLLYPEITRRLMLNGAEIVFCPSFWAGKSTSYDYGYNNKYFKKEKPKEVDFLVSARAIESGIIFVYSNAAGRYINKNSKSQLLGRTQIALPFYGSTSRLNHNKEGSLIKEVDLDIVKDAGRIYKIKEDIKDYYNKA